MSIWSNEQVNNWVPNPRGLRPQPSGRRNPARFAADNFKWLIGGLAVLLGLAFISLGILVPHWASDNVTFKVTDKWIKQKSGSHDQTYMVGTNHGVYEDTDSFAFFKFNSSDVYSQLQRGKTYNCLVSGFRVPILSSNRNIISCTEVGHG